MDDAGNKVVYLNPYLNESKADKIARFVKECPLARWLKTHKPHYTQIHGYNSRRTREAQERDRLQKITKAP
jgi:hypothetical protein